MKKLFIILLTMCCFALGFMLSACNVSDSPESSVDSSIAGPAMETTTSTPQTEPESTPEATDGDITNETTIPDTTSVSDSTETDETSDVEESTRVPEFTTSETKPVTESRPTESTTVTKPVEDDPKVETSQTTEPPQTETETVEPEPPSDPKATASDTRAVAQKVLEYVNEFRTSPAVQLTGLTSYAEYRSRQLVSNFAHDTADQRAAATALQYGEYVDPSVFGGSGEPYYRANAREAIAKAGYVGTVDEVALKLATLVKNSQNHWNYIGSSEYSYIAVGVTYESGMWYCAITVASENTDEY